MSTQEEVMDYVMNTPHNTNPAVLKSLIDNLPVGGQTEPLIVTISNGDGIGEYVCDKSFDEISQAGLNVVAYYPLDQIYMSVASKNSTTVSFSYMRGTSLSSFSGGTFSNLTYYYFTISDTDSVNGGRYFYDPSK